MAKSPRPLRNSVLLEKMTIHHYVSVDNTDHCAVISEGSELKKGSLQPCNHCANTFAADSCGGSVPAVQNIASEERLFESSECGLAASAAEATYSCRGTQTLEHRQSQQSRSRSLHHVSRRKLLCCLLCLLLSVRRRLGWKWVHSTGGEKYRSRFIPSTMKMQTTSFLCT